MTYNEENSTFRPASTWPRMLVVAGIAIAVVGVFWGVGWVTSTRNATAAPPEMTLASRESTPVEPPAPGLTDRWLPPSADPAPTASIPPALQDTAAPPGPALASRWIPDDNTAAPARDTSARPAEPPKAEPPPWVISEPQAETEPSPPPTMDSAIEGPVPVPRPKPRVAANRMPGYVPVPRPRPDGIPAASGPSIFGLFTPATPGEDDRDRR